jgi:hypothetical protein
MPTPEACADEQAQVQALEAEVRALEAEVSELEEELDGRTGHATECKAQADVMAMMASGMPYRWEEVDFASEWRPAGIERRAGALVARCPGLAIGALRCEEAPCFVVFTAEDRACEGVVGEEFRDSRWEVHAGQLRFVVYAAPPDWPPPDEADNAMWRSQFRELGYKYERTR